MRAPHASTIIIVIATMFLSMVPSGVILATSTDGESRALGQARGGEDGVGGGSRAFDTRITAFADGNLTVNYTFPSMMKLKDALIRVPNNAYIGNASFTVAGSERTGTMEYPEAVSIDVGDDGDVQWAFNGTGYGALGYQSRLSTGASGARANVTGGAWHDVAGLFLPKKAAVTSAILDAEVLFEVTADIVFNGSYEGDNLGASVAVVGDVNGDGIGDIAVGVPNYDAGFGNEGAVYIFFGGAMVNTTPDVKVIGENSWDNFGTSVSGGVDFNMDGYDDVIVGSPGADSGGLSTNGKVYIFFGGKPMDTGPDITFMGQSNSSELGKTVAGAGDLNNDGAGDYVVGAPGYGEAVGEVTVSYGRAYVLLGSATPDGTPDLTMQGLVACNLGVTVAGLGDVNNDGYDDFAVATTQSDIGGKDSGRVEVFYGGTVVDATHDVDLVGRTGEMLGAVIAGAGDINGDGYGDVLVQAQKYKMDGFYAGAVYMFMGGGPMNNASDMLFIPGDSGGDFGSAIAALGDVNNDGRPDIAIGSEGNTTSAAYMSGAVFVYMGTGAGIGIDNVSDAVISGEAAHDTFGCALAGLVPWKGALDTDKDSYTEFMVGAESSDAKVDKGGRAYLFRPEPRHAVNPAIDVGGVGNVDWSTIGIFAGSVHISGLQTDLNTIVSGASTNFTDAYGNAFVYVPIRVKSDTDAAFVVQSLGIRYVYETEVSAGPLGSLGEEMNASIPHTGNGTVELAVAINATGGVVTIGDLDMVLDVAPVFVSNNTNYSVFEDTIVANVHDIAADWKDDGVASKELNFTILNQTHADKVLVWLNGTMLGVDVLTGDANDNWTGNITFFMNAMDPVGLVRSSSPYKIQVKQVNDPPIILSSPPMKVMTGVAYAYQLEARDAETNARYLRYIVSQGPVGMDFSAGTPGLLRYTPQVAGEYPVALAVDDGQYQVYQNYTLRVSKTNAAPDFETEPLLEAPTDIPYSYELKCMDPDKDPVTLALKKGPSGMTLGTMPDPYGGPRVYGFLNWTPNASEMGNHTVSLSAFDGLATAYQNFTLKVTNAGGNHVPVFRSWPKAEAAVNWSYEYAVDVTDEDGDDITLELHIGPEGMRLSDDAVVRWVPGAAQTGSMTVLLRATDGHAWATQSFTITVVDRHDNHIPKVTSTPPGTAFVGETYEYDIKATDEDLDTVTFQLETEHHQMELNSTSGVLIWHPTAKDLGLNGLLVRASDGKGHAAHKWTVEVEAGSMNELPEVLTDPRLNATVGKEYYYQIDALDPDGDKLGFTLVEGPPGLILDRFGNIVWTPNASDAGKAFHVKVKIDDGKGYRFHEWDITVAPLGPDDLKWVIIINVTSHQENEDVKGMVSLAGTVSVQGGTGWNKVLWVNVSVRGERPVQAQYDGESQWLYPINTDRFDNGPLTVVIYAEDAQGNRANRTFALKVENPRGEDNTGSMSMAWFWWLIVLILVVTAIVVIVKSLTWKESRVPPRSMSPGEERLRRVREAERVKRARRGGREGEREGGAQGRIRGGYRGWESGPNARPRPRRDTDVTGRGARYGPDGGREDVEGGGRYDDDNNEGGYGGPARQEYARDGGEDDSSSYGGNERNYGNGGGRRDGWEGEEGDEYEGGDYDDGGGREAPIRKSVYRRGKDL